MRELQGYRDELESLLEFTNNRHTMTVSELAEYDYGKPENKQKAYYNAARTKKHYRLCKGENRVSVLEIARRKAIERQRSGAVDS